MKTLQKLLEGTAYEMHPITFDKGKTKGWSITGGTQITGWVYKGKPEIMELCPIWMITKGKVWRISIHKDSFSQLGFSILYLKPHEFKQLKKHLQ